MPRARGDRGLDGFVNLCKPSGPTSHDLVSQARRVLSTRRIGHAGTLDPLAEGVLPLAVGRATRLIQELSDSDKEYRVGIKLGLTTTTDDSAGEIVQENVVPRLSRATLETALATFRGSILQRPPAYSAVKIEGQRAYSLARRGVDVRIAPRTVEIHELALLSWNQPVLWLRIRCSKGTYVRSLARDLGQVLGTGAHVVRLARTRVGPFALAQAISVDELAASGDAAVLPPDAVLEQAPAVVFGGTECDHLTHGRSWRGTVGPIGRTRAYALGGDFAGLVEYVADTWTSRLSFLD